MGEKADRLNVELVPTRSLLRRVADYLGVELDESITADNVRRYERKFMESINRLRDSAHGIPHSVSRPDPDTKTFDQVIDEAIEEAEQGGLTAIEHGAPGALAKRSDITTEFDQDANNQALNIELIKQIAKMVGADADDLVSIRVAIERAMGEGGDIEVPKGDTLGDAMRHGHQQNHDLRMKIKEFRLLVQRIAAALQLVDWKPDGDGTEVLQAIQRIETGKVMMRRRILELRQGRVAGATVGPAIADELESQFTRLLSPQELAEWTRKGGSAKPRQEIAPHPFVFNHGDIGLLVRAISDRTTALPFGGERSRLSDLHTVMEETRQSPEAAAHFASAMEAILMVLARERASRLKE